MIKHAVTFLGVAMLPSAVDIGRTLWLANHGHLIKFDSGMAFAAMALVFVVVLGWLAIAAGFAVMVIRRRLRWRAVVATVVVALLCGTWLAFGSRPESVGETAWIWAYFLSAVPLGLVVFGKARVATQCMQRAP